MIRLHHVAQARSFRILWLLHELDEQVEIIRHSMFDKSLRGADYLQLSPAGRVPALEVDGIVLFESGAITEYLCETRGRLAPRPGQGERADWLEWLHFGETVGNHIANLTQQHIMLRDPSMRSFTVMKLETTRLKRTVEVAERALEGRDWLLPSGFSAADTQMGYSVMMARRFIRTDDLPNVTGWLSRIHARPAFVRATAEDGVPEIYTRDFYELPDA